MADPNEAPAPAALREIADFMLSLAREGKLTAFTAKHFDFQLRTYVSALEAKDREIALEISRQLILIREIQALRDDADADAIRARGESKP